MTNSTYRSGPLGLLADIDKMRDGPLAYYSQLLDSPDEVLRCAAWCAMLDGNALTAEMHDDLLSQCNVAAVRKRAFDYFESIFEHDLALTAAETFAPSFEEAQQRAMAATLSDDPAEQLTAEVACYLATGATTYLIAASREAEAIGGSAAGLEWAVRALAAQPINGQMTHKLIDVLEASGQSSLLKSLGELFSSSGVLKHVGEYCIASAENLAGETAQCIARARRLQASPAFKGQNAKFQEGLLKILAEAHHKAGNYTSSFEADIALNKRDAAQSNQDPQEFYRVVGARDMLDIPVLPDDPRTDCVGMVGFPRSGTTLLENVLAAHPMIETLEEAPTLQAAVARLDRAAVAWGKNSNASAEPYLKARLAYYEEVDRRRKKKSATVIIDKLPIRSANAIFLKKLFPGQRFIFSIRHPFDVALSCVKQRFVPNPAMENFHSLGDAARIYDFTMSKWFSVHTMDDPVVHYVRYDELVDDFTRTISGTLEFLGVPWSDEVHMFAKRAEERRAKTPSYQKVRQGLTIGVQSNWRNYQFAFEGDDVKPLYKWAEFFGYETK